MPTGHCTSTASFFKDISKYQGKSKASRAPAAVLFRYGGDFEFVEITFVTTCCHLFFLYSLLCFCALNCSTTKQGCELWNFLWVFSSYVGVFWTCLSSRHNLLCRAPHLELLFISPGKMMRELNVDLAGRAEPKERACPIQLPGSCPFGWRHG